MPHPALSASIARVGRAVDSANDSDITDGQLLTRFVRTRDQAAFAELVRRLGPLVLGVCRRVLGDEHLAEDAFQATFVVLARRCADVRSVEGVRGWLYGVAVRTARRARSMSARHRAREALVTTPPERIAETAHSPNTDALHALDEEIAALSGPLRAAVVLCELDGVSRKVAAASLGIPEGTLSSRLAAARTTLARRLRNRGIALSTAGLTAALGQVAQAIVPTSLSLQTVAIATTPGLIPAPVAMLSNGVLRLMLVHKLKSLTVVVGLIAAGICGGLIVAADLPPTKTDGYARLDPQGPTASPNLRWDGGNTSILLLAAPVPALNPPRQLVASSNHTGNWEIYLVDADSKETKNLTNHKARDTDPAWSPDGKRIAFVSDRRGQPELWLMAADGSDPQPVSADTAGCSWLRWSPDGNRIAFVAQKDDKEDIYTTEVATGKVTVLTAEEFSSGEPMWSPDGKNLVYSYFQKKTPKWSLFTMNADGSDKQDVGGPDGGIEGAWSPSGKRLVFTRLDDEGYRLFTMGATGDNVQSVRTVAAPSAAHFAQWSPDEKMLALREWNMTEQLAQVAVVGADGNGYKILTTGAPHSHPRWSLDGKSLSYGRFPDKHGYFREDEAAVLIVSDATGKHPRELLAGYGRAEWRPR